MSDRKIVALSKKKNNIKLHASDQLSKNPRRRKKNWTLHVRESNPGRLRDRQKCYQLHQHGLGQSGIIEALTSLFVDQYRANILLKTIRLIIRSYHGGYTASHPNCEVKHPWARSVLRWGTTRESRVLNVFFHLHKFFFIEQNFFLLNNFFFLLNKFFFLFTNFFVFCTAYTTKT